jgi:hypothetical protein
VARGIALIYDDLRDIAQTEFSDVVQRIETIGRRAALPLKLRLHLRDETFVDVWLNPTATDYSYHWEHRAKRGLIHRHDNAPDHPHLSTHPKHFHNGSEDNVEPSSIPDNPAEALRTFLQFVRAKLIEYDQGSA